MPYTGIVEGYFNANEMSVLLQKKFDRYKELANKEKLTKKILMKLQNWKCI